MVAEPPDPVFEAIEFGILGQDRDLTRHDVEHLSGEPLARIDALWRALGFTTADSDERIYTFADIDALQTLTSLVEIGFIDEGAEIALARSMGRSFARLAEWEVGVMADLVLSDAVADDLGTVDLDAIQELIARTMPAVEQLQDYIWRRHLAAAAGRVLLRPQSADSAAHKAIGFADIVGFTRRSRELDAEQLAALVEHFEQQVSLEITQQGGRVIKTIGDEVMFEADDPVAAARIALALASRHVEDDAFPEVRVGAAYGEVLNRLGDVFGEVVNIAARLTSVARPGRALVDRGLAAELEEHTEEFRVRRQRAVSVKGYSRLDCFLLRHPKPPTDERGLPEPLEVLDTMVEAIAERLPDRLPTPERRRVRSKPAKRDKQEP